MHISTTRRAANKLSQYSLWIRKHVNCTAYHLIICILVFNGCKSPLHEQHEITKNDFRNIIIPNITLKDALISEALLYIVNSQRYINDWIIPKQKVGHDFVEFYIQVPPNNINATNALSRSVIISCGPRISISRTNIPLIDLLKEVTVLANGQLTIDKNTIHIKIPHVNYSNKVQRKLVEPW